MSKSVLHSNLEFPSLRNTRRAARAHRPPGCRRGAPERSRAHSRRPEQSAARHDAERALARILQRVQHVGMSGHRRVGRPVPWHCRCCGAAVPHNDLERTSCLWAAGRESVAGRSGRLADAQMKAGAGAGSLSLSLFLCFSLSLSLSMCVCACVCVCVCLW